MIESRFYHEPLVAPTLALISFQGQALFRVDAELVAQKLRARKRHIFLVFKAKKVYRLSASTRRSPSTAVRRFTSMPLKAIVDVIWRDHVLHFFSTVNWVVCTVQVVVFRAPSADYARRAFV